MSMRDFKVIKPLGSGAFAAVFKVERRSDGKIYALKRVGIGKMSKREVADCLNEVRLLASLRHPNIVGFFEAFLDKNDTELCIIMELCGNGDLSSKVEKHKKARRYIDEKQIWAYLMQGADALRVMHDMNIMHRDIKAANIFLGEDGSLKMGDMNVSKNTKGGLVHTQIGTPYYMAPEIWANRPYSPAVDMWALGCLIYELCALRPPFLADSFPALKRTIMAGRYPPLPKTYSYELQTVVSRLLRLNPNERPTSNGVMSMPEVLKWKERAGDASPLSPLGQAKLIKTIQVPRRLSQISNALPKPCYPDARPDSPEAWPATERSVADEVRARRASVQRAPPVGGNLGGIKEEKARAPSAPRPTDPSRDRRVSAAARQDSRGGVRGDSRERARQGSRQEAVRRDSRQGPRQDSRGDVRQPAARQDSRGGVRQPAARKDSRQGPRAQSPALPPINRAAVPQVNAQRRVSSGYDRRPSANGRGSDVVFKYQNKYANAPQKYYGVRQNQVPAAAAPKPRLSAIDRGGAPVPQRRASNGRYAHNNGYAQPRAVPGGGQRKGSAGPGWWG